VPSGNEEGRPGDALSRLMLSAVAYFGCPPRLVVVVVVVSPVSLLLLHDDVCVSVVVLTNGVPCPLSFGEVSVVVSEHVFTLSAEAAAGVSATAAATSTAPIILRDVMSFSRP
jgi:hypothetical protein